MGLTGAALRTLIESMAFRVSVAPYLILDTDLRIRAANSAYERATLHHTSEMVGEFMFDVFPDNPATPEVQAVERLGASFERALSSGQPDWMGLQPYDVSDRLTGAFIDKSWLPRNWPIRDPDGRTVGVLHHVEDVTHLVVSTALERHLVAPLLLTGPRPRGGTNTLMEALIRDSAARRTRGQLLVDQSRQAMDRMSRRMDISDRRTRPKPRAAPGLAIQPSRTRTTPAELAQAEQGASADLRLA